MKKILSLIPLSIIIILFGCGEDSPTEPSGTIQGIVKDKDSNVPLSNVTVTLDDKKVYTTDQTGIYQFTNVSEGTHQICAKNEEYVLCISELYVKSGNNEFDIQLETMSAYCNRTPTISYRGKEYRTVLIGHQCWLKDNMNVGIRIDGRDEQTNNSVVEKYCYLNQEENCDTYGGLYQWDEVMQYVTTEGAQGICPDGWHIPTSDEISTLKLEVDNSANSLKAVGQGTGTNTSGFSVLLAGCRDLNQNFHSLEAISVIWSSTGQGSDDAYYLWIWGSEDNFTFEDRSKNFAFSVRCLKD